MPSLEGAAMPFIRNKRSSESGTHAGSEGYEAVIAAAELHFGTWPPQALIQ